MALVEHRALLGSRHLDIGNVGLTLLQLNNFDSLVKTRFEEVPAI